MVKTKYIGVRKLSNGKYRASVIHGNKLFRKSFKNKHKAALWRDTKVVELGLDSEPLNFM